MTERISPGSNNPNRSFPSNNVYISADQVLMDHAPFLVEAAQDGIRDVAALMNSPLSIDVVGSSWSEGEYGSTQYFTDRARIRDESGRHEGKILWNALRSHLATDPYRDSSPHLGYMLTVGDMTALDADNRAMNFVFGVTDKSIGQSVQSIYRFIESGLTMDLTKLVTRHIARHEFGHLVGLDDDTIKNQDRRGGLYTGHCMNECTMEQVVSVSETVSLASKLAHKHNGGFCNDCAGYLAHK